MASGDSEETFRLRRAALIDGAEPSAGDDLLGMLMDFEHYWSESEALDDVAVIATGDPANLIEVTAIARSGATDDQVDDELVRVWMDHLRYGFAEAHVVARDVAGVRMQAITKIAPRDFYVTASVTVTR